MKRVPDIKTVDSLFEILSNPEETKKQLAELRKVRDEIRSSLETKETIDSARKKLNEATTKHAEATALMEEFEQYKASTLVELEAHEKRQKENAAVAASSLSGREAELAERESAFDRKQAKAEADIKKRESAVVSREIEAEKKMSEALALKEGADRIIGRAKELVG